MAILMALLKGTSVLESGAQLVERLTGDQRDAYSGLTAGRVTV